MGHYLKFPASTGDSLNNNPTLEIKGISGVLASVSITVKEPAASFTLNRFLFDDRRGISTILTRTGTAFISQDTTYFVSGVSNFRINGSIVTVEQLCNTFVVDDVLSFDVGTTPSEGCIAIGGRHTEQRSFYGLSISSITIVDGAGSHTIDMSDSAGTGTSVLSGDSAITATLFGFPANDNHWIFYDTTSPSISLSGVYAPAQTLGVATANFTGVPLTTNLMDTGNNALNISLTATGGGNYTFPLPALPAAGASSPGLLFGNVTVTITDPGA